MKSLHSLLSKKKWKMSLNQRDKLALLVIALAKIIKITSGLPHLFTSGHRQRIYSQAAAKSGRLLSCIKTVKFTFYRVEKSKLRLGQG